MNPIPPYPAAPRYHPPTAAAPAPLNPPPPRPAFRSSASLSTSTPEVPKSDIKRPRACESCRGLKVRCTPSVPNNLKSTCRRCARANRPCIFTLPTRKRQRRTDTKVAELERKVEALTASLRAATTTTTHDEHSTEVDDAGEWAQGDVVSRGVVGELDARRLLGHYNSRMMPLFPAVVVGGDVRELQRRPTLLLAVLAVASGSLREGVHRVLQAEVTRCFAERILVLGEKSLELVQALLVVALWYYPAGADHKYYTLLHQAAIMALDLGLGKVRSSTAPQPGAVDLPAEAPGAARHVYPDSTTLESRRTYAACFWTTSNIAVTMRRPLLLRPTGFLVESQALLAASECEGDRTLAGYVRLQMTACAVHAAYALDEPAADIGFGSAGLREALAAASAELGEYARGCEEGVLKMNCQTLLMYVHEPVLWTGHNVEDFRPPFSEWLGDGVEAKGGFAVGCLVAMKQAALGLARGFMVAGDDVRVLPVFVYTRVAYAVMVLVRLQLAGEAGVDEVEEVCIGVLGKFVEAGGRERGSVQGRFALVVCMMRDWWVRWGERQSGQDGDEDGDEGEDEEDDDEQIVSGEWGDEDAGMLEYRDQEFGGAVAGFEVPPERFWGNGW